MLITSLFLKAFFRCKTFDLWAEFFLTSQSVFRAEMEISLKLAIEMCTKVVRDGGGKRSNKKNKTSLKIKKQSNFPRLEKDANVAFFQPQFKFSSVKDVRHSLRLYIKVYFLFAFNFFRSYQITAANIYFFFIRIDHIPHLFPLFFWS